MDNGVGNCVGLKVTSVGDALGTAVGDALGIAVGDRVGIISPAYDICVLLEI